MRVGARASRHPIRHGRTTASWRSSQAGFSRPGAASSAARLESRGRARGTASANFLTAADRRPRPRSSSVVDRKLIARCATMAWKCRPADAFSGRDRSRLRGPAVSSSTRHARCTHSGREKAGGNGRAIAVGDSHRNDPVGSKVVEGQLALRRQGELLGLCKVLQVRLRLVNQG